MARMSIATIDKPEFINIKPYNPLISECEIKVMYIGENRNRSYITKEVATEMANSLPGCPIVGYFKKDKQDFADHGERVIFDDEGMHFECMTRPYGFVAPNAKVWFQKFEVQDDFGNIIIREYLMTTGFLWTGQYPECKEASSEEGKPHSMELDEDTLNGEWSKNYKTGMDFFIINDAIFSKLCILGDDVEPCFEESSVTAPNISASFTKEVDENFKKTLFDMMQELKFALKGEKNMSKIDETQLSLESEETTTAFSKIDDDKEEDKEKFSKDEKDKENKDDKSSEDKNKEEKEDEEKKFSKKEEEEEENKKDEDKENKTSEEENKKDDEEDKKKFSLLEQEYAALKEKYSSLESNYNSLLEFKNQIEEEKKDALIKSFYMLSDEDKAEVIANKANYSLDDIEAKLSVICVRKKVNFDLEDTTKIEDKVENPVTTFSLEEQVSSVPAWVTALKNTKNSRRN